MNVTIDEHHRGQVLSRGFQPISPRVVVGSRQVEEALEIRRGEQNSIRGQTYSPDRPAARARTCIFAGNRSANDRDARTTAVLEPEFYLSAKPRGAGAFGVRNRGARIFSENIDWRVIIDERYPAKLTRPASPCP